MKVKQSNGHSEPFSSLLAISPVLDDFLPVEVSLSGCCVLCLVSLCRVECRLSSSSCRSTLSVGVTNLVHSRRRPPLSGYRHSCAELTRLEMTATVCRRRCIVLHSRLQNAPYLYRQLTRYSHAHQLHLRHFSSSNISHWSPTSPTPHGAHSTTPIPSTLNHQPQLHELTTTSTSHSTDQAATATAAADTDSTPPDPSPEAEAELRSLNSQIATLFATAEYETALPLATRAADIALKLFGDAHPAYASAVNNSALIHKHNQQYDTAATLYQQALLSYQLAVGPAHPSTLTAANNLALAYKQLGETDKAVQLLERVLADRTRLLGADHPHTAASMHHLALLLAASSPHSPRALQLASEALRLTRRRHGSESLEAATAMNNLGYLHKQRGEHSEAMGWYERALGVRSRGLVAGHADVVVAMNNVAECWRAQGKEEKAREVQEKIVAMVEEAERKKQAERNKQQKVQEDNNKR